MKPHRRIGYFAPLFKSLESKNNLPVSAGARAVARFVPVAVVIGRVIYITAITLAANLSTLSIGNDAEESFLPDTKDDMEGLVGGRPSATLFSLSLEADRG